MKILWYVNIIMPKAAQAFELKAQAGGGWLIGQADMLADSGAELFILNATPLVKNKVQRQVENINYILIPSKDNEYNDSFKSIISEINPDIVHVFGTEYKYNTDLIKLCKASSRKCVVSMQGLMGDYAKHYLDGLPEKYKKIPLTLAAMKKLYYSDSIALGQKAFELQGNNEAEALQQCDYVIGRTQCDKSFTQNINPQIRYFHVNENLRSGFYTDEKWCESTCQKHSIFVSQAFYPIKGFHQLLKAMPRLIKTYPDLHVYVGGQAAYTLKNKFFDIFVDYFFQYQAYVKKLIKADYLQSYITFTDSLNETQMKERYLKSNVFLCCSSYENSPNSVGEAMLLGVPVVSSDRGGVSTMLADKQDGLLYDFYDTEKMIDCICEIFDNADKAEFYSVNAQNHAKATHDKKANTAALLQAYNIILQGG